MTNPWEHYDEWKTDPDYGRPLAELKREEEEELFREKVDDAISDAFWKAYESLGYDAGESSLKLDELLIEFTNEVTDLLLEEEAKEAKNYCNDY